MKSKKIIKYLAYPIGILIILTILLSSLAQLYKDRNKIFNKIGVRDNLEHINPEAHNALNPIYNPLTYSKRQIPPKQYDELITYGNEHIEGAWTATFDWNVIAIHSVLLPDGNVLTYGTYAADLIESNKDIRENKKMILTDGFEIDRDWGFNQWQHHNVNGAVDFDIWDPSKGVGSESHTLIKKPIVLDAFCSVVRVLDLENLFMLGGNNEPKPDGPDTQNATVFYKIKNKEFIKGSPLNYGRWYGSIVRLANDNFVMVGGEETTVTCSPVPPRTNCKSIIPEILEKGDNNIYYWRALEGAKSMDLFDEADADEWSYPKAYLASDGNVFGISYNKMWVLDPTGNGSIEKVGEIPLETGGITRIAKNDYRMNTTNEHNEVSRLILGTIGAPVGSRSTTVMIDTDKIMQMGGKQWGEYGDITTREPADFEQWNPKSKWEDYLPSNHANLIDISNSKQPVVKKLKQMNYPRADSNAVILPDGNVIVFGGHSYREPEFSVLTPEIYNVSSDEWFEMAPGSFRRNYHASALLLPNGTILVAGGDTWNAEIFYPPYLFEEDWYGNPKFAKRPIINKVAKTISSRKKIELDLDNTDNITTISLISTGSSTHSQNSELKYKSLDFNVINKNKIIFSIPENKNIIQNGTYLIFAVNNSGTPSIGEIVYVEG